MRKIFVRSAFNYDPNVVSRETGTCCAEDEDKTVQSFKEEADINVLVRRFGITGQMPQGVVPPTYGVFEDVFDFKSAMDAIAVARESFDAMPGDVRAKFQNDPQKFVEFCSNKDNLPEMRKMGLAIPEVVVDNIDVADVPPVKEKANARSVKKGAVGGSEAVKGPDGSVEGE